MSTPAVDWVTALLWSSATPDEEAELYLWSNSIAEAAKHWQASRSEPAEAGEQHDAHVQAWRAMRSATRDAAE